MSGSVLTKKEKLKTKWAALEALVGNPNASRSWPLTGPFFTAAWLAKVASCRLVPGHIVKQETGFEPSSDKAHYLLFKLADISPFDLREVSSLVSTANGTGDGGKFRTFQTDFKTVMQQKLYYPAPAGA